MTIFESIFWFLPILLACISVIVCSMEFTRTNNFKTKFLLFLSIIASMLLILAQTSWWSTFSINHSAQVTNFEQSAWLMFNTITPIVFVGYALLKRK